MTAAQTQNVPIFFCVLDPALAQVREKCFSFCLIFSSLMASNARE